VVDDALALQVEAYALLKQDFESQQALALLKANYPDHEQLDEEGNFIASGLTKEDRRTLIGVMSFGLIE
jgi:outer membrane protein assembly factor BamD